MDQPLSSLQLSIAPLGAGDLIDRAVRFYRSNFWVFILIAAPPIVAGTIFSAGWTMFGRFLFFSGASISPDATVFHTLFSWFGGVIIWLIETVATLTVMGGASRSFVQHLLFNDPITFRATYRYVRKRLAALIAAAALLSILIGVLGTAIVYLGLFIGIIVVMVTVSAFSFVPFVAFIVSFVLGLATAFGTGWLFFLIASRFAYVPQIMLVEGLGVMKAIGRSASLASGNVKRFAALFIFTTVATYSALSLFYIPLGWYAYLEGVELFSFGASVVPAWYEIAGQLIWQASFILLTPIWMIGLCLLYVDERVRHEGYDIELLAARRLGEIPAVPTQFVNPLQPALSHTPTQTPPAREQNSSILGLN